MLQLALSYRVYVVGKAYMEVSTIITELVPQLGALHFKGHWEGLLVGGHRKRAFQLEQLPYCLGSSLSNLLDAIMIQESIINKIDSRAYDRNTEYTVPDSESDKLSYRIDAFFESSVRTQNALWPYLQLTAKRSIPFSLRDIVSNIKKLELSFGETIDAVIVNYWDDDGEKLRDYRDLSQHYVVVPSDARVLITQGVIQSFYMPLPHNPKARNTDKLQYDNNSPDTIPYCQNSFLKLVEFVRIVIKELLGSSIREPRSFKWVRFKEGMIGFAAKGTPIISSKAFEQQLLELAEYIKNNEKT